MSDLAAVIDIGSNSIKLSIAEKDNKRIKIIDSLKRIVPLGKSVFNKGKISVANINKVVDVINDFKNIINSYQIKNVKIIATTAAREASNKDIFVDTVKRKTGYLIEVLSVSDVVYYIDSYVMYAYKDKINIQQRNVMIIELGGGSLDISVLVKGNYLFSVGLPIGVMRLDQLYKELDGNHSDIIDAVNEYVVKEIKNLSYYSNISDTKIDEILLVDENFSPYVSAIFEPGLCHSSELYKVLNSNIEKVYKYVCVSPKEHLSKKYGIPVEMAGLLMHFFTITRNFDRIVDKGRFYMLRATLAEALLNDMIFSEEQTLIYNSVQQMVHFAEFICKKYNSDEKHIKYVVNLSDILFDEFSDDLGLNEKYKIHLILAAYFHDLGQFIHNRSHHKHSEYIISAQRFFRLDENDIDIISCIARYHRKTDPKLSHPVFARLSKENKIVVRKMSAIIKIANAFDASHSQKVKKLEVTHKNSSSVIRVWVDSNFLLEEKSISEVKKSMEELVGNKISVEVNDLL